MTHPFFLQLNRPAQFKVTLLQEAEYEIYSGDDKDEMEDAVRRGLKFYPGSRARVENRLTGRTSTRSK